MKCILMNHCDWEAMPKAMQKIPRMNPVVTYKKVQKQQSPSSTELYTQKNKRTTHGKPNTQTPTQSMVPASQLPFRAISKNLGKEQASSNSTHLNQNNKIADSMAANKTDKELRTGNTTSGMADRIQEKPSSEQLAANCAGPMAPARFGLTAKYVF